MRLVGSVTEKFCLNVEDETMVRKDQFQDLVKMPKWERSKTPWQKLFTSHLLTSPENQKKMRDADKVARKKEKHVIEKQQLRLTCNCMLNLAIAAFISLLSQSFKIQPNEVFPDLHLVAKVYPDHGHHLAPNLCLLCQPC